MGRSKKADQARPFDATFKQIVERRPRDTLAFLGITEVISVEIVETDFSTVISAADKVLKVVDSQGTYLVHLEFQTGPDEGLESRVFWYNAYLYHHHRVPVRSVVFLLTRQADRQELDGEFVLSLPKGREVHRFRYQVERLWETAVETIMTGGVGLLPLALLSKHAEPKIEAIIQRMEERFQKEVTETEQRDLWAATFFLMGLNYPPDLVRRIIRGGYGMKESSTYQLTLAEGEAKGLVKGREEGQEEGKYLEARKFLLRLAKKFLGEPSRADLTRINRITDVDQLEFLGERLLEVKSWAELLKSLPKTPTARKKDA